MRNLIRGVVAGAMARDSNTILHTHVLAFGLALKDISVAIQTRRSMGSVEPPFFRFSLLVRADLDFVTAELENLLRWAGHPMYNAGGGKREKKPTAKAAVAETGPSKGTRSKNV